MGSYPLVDLHCHLDLYDDFPNVVTEAERAGVRTLAITTTPRAWSRNRDMTSGLRYVRPALGLHPQLVGENTSRELALWEKYLVEARFVGEVGLDAGRQYWHTLDQQKSVFEHVLRSCASAGGKVISVHAVRSAQIVLDMIEAFLPPDRGRVVLHWFSGSTSQARRAVELGCFFSVNMPMLTNERGRDLIMRLPRDHILTETDGPFTRHGDRPSRPSDVGRHLEVLGEVLGLAPRDIAVTIATNLRSLLDDKWTTPQQNWE